jgi:cytochrome c-type biogenesis protein CcmE
VGTDLDRELARAARLDPASHLAADEPQVTPARRASEPPGAARGRAAVGLLVVLLLLVGAIVGLVLLGLGEASVYSVRVDELVARRAELVGRHVRIEGELEPGSLGKRDRPCEHRFVLRARGARLMVRYGQCVVPATLRDEPEGGVLVTAEGKLTAAGDFEASLVLAKCSSRYDPATRRMRPRTAPTGEAAAP